MLFLIVLLGLITLIVCVSQIVSFRRLCAHVERELAVDPSDYRPKLAVILPCKGLDPGFADNVVRLMQQDYLKDGRPHFEVFFTVAEADDPAYPVLKKIADSQVSLKAHLVIAGKSEKRAQKVNNQLAALATIPDDVEVLVFVDSDVIARPDFLACLVARLEDPKIGATTGYRFYIPYRGDGPSLIRSLWNRMSAWELANPHYAFAWGGAMAIKRSTFAEARIIEAWDRSADDDLALTTAVKSLGLTVHFVPQCLVASHGDGTLAEIVEWTNRQLILTKVYYPRLWRRAIARATVMAVWLVAVLFAAVQATSGDPIAVTALVLGLSVLPLELWFLVRAQSLWQRVLSDRQGEIDSAFWRFCLALPLAHLTLPWMTLYSVLTNRIQWRGVTYELRSPTETVVI